MTAKKSKISGQRGEQSSLQMTALQARAFLMKSESYCGIDLPGYSTFARLLSAVTKKLSGKALASMSSKLRDQEGVKKSKFGSLKPIVRPKEIEFLVSERY